MRSGKQDSCGAPRPLLSRLARDKRGNTLAIVAAAMFPMLAMIGSGIDMSRAYMAQNRLRQACDAGALAGRRLLSGPTVTTAIKDETKKYFNFNFPQRMFETETFDITPTITVPTTGTVKVTAATRMPTTIMKLFGFSSLPISATCAATQDFVNTDIVLVLDTTGSMASKASSTDTSSKIVALRSAVLALYDQLAAVQTKLQASNLRLRYGVVPYSSTVNVGAAIKAVNPSYLVQGNDTYQSRQVATGVMLPNACTSLSGSYFLLTATCTYFKYLPRKDYNTTPFVNGNSVNIAPLIGTADSTGKTPTLQIPKYVSWAGCTEERQTTPMSASATSIPAGAYDLDIDKIPSDDASKWTPYLPELEYASYPINLYQGDPYKPQVACPTAAAPMKIWTRADLNTYLNTLDPDGGTYHDFGMMWGARWASANGIFGASNPDVYNGMPVKKYIIFMTDGLFETGYDRLYSGYGIEKLDARVTPGGNASDQNDQLARHKTRFGLLCSKAKTMGYSVWVIGFATSLDTSLTNCASNASQASTSSDSDDLIAKFVEIGKNIGALRLTQ